MFMRLVAIRRDISIAEASLMRESVFHDFGVCSGLAVRLQISTQCIW